jgi:hypothetical protein
MSTGASASKYCLQYAVPSLVGGGAFPSKYARMTFAYLWLAHALLSSVCSGEKRHPRNSQRSFLRCALSYGVECRRPHIPSSTPPYRCPVFVLLEGPSTIYVSRRLPLSSVQWPYRCPAWFGAVVAGRSLLARTKPDGRLRAFPLAPVQLERGQRGQALEVRGKLCWG